FYTVLMEGDDQQDPLVDALRSLVDGHIMLDRRLASENHYPPIAILDSLSRLMPAVAAREHLTRSSQLRSLLAAYTRSEDLIRIGAYSKGADPVLDRAIAVLPQLQALLRQTPQEQVPFAEAIARLNSIAC
ncbi:MAG: flagellum-specific ATP synthase FliI, partial [Candidatus Korobacteraceae bacterium]